MNAEKVYAKSITAGNNVRITETQVKIKILIPGHPYISGILTVSSLNMNIKIFNIEYIYIRYWRFEYSYLKTRTIGILRISSTRPGVGIFIKEP